MNAYGRIAGLAVSLSVTAKQTNEQTKEERRKLVRLAHTRDSEQKMPPHDIAVVTVSVQNVWRNEIELDFRAQVVCLCAPPMHRHGRPTALLCCSHAAYCANKNFAVKILSHS